jgi:hypothetical protein
VRILHFSVQIWILLKKLVQTQVKPFHSEEVTRGHSVRISDGYVDNMMTLYRLRRPSGHPLDDT